MAAWGRDGRRYATRSRRGLGEVMELFCILTVVVVMGLYVFVKTHRAVYHKVLV